jgi:hypothetical protein
MFSRAAAKNTWIGTGQVTDDKELTAIVWTPGMFASVGNGRNGHEKHAAAV